MKRLLGMTIVSLLTLSGCTATKTSDKSDGESSGLFGLNKAEPKIAVPSGASRVVLHQGVGTDTSTPGSEFTGNFVLSKPVDL